MPRGDRTGPAGMGAMSGWAAGHCAGYPTPGFMTNTWGRFFRCGGRSGFWCHTGGRGQRNWYYATGMTGWQRAATEIPGYRPSTIKPFNPALAKETKLGVLKKQAEYHIPPVF